MFVKTLIGQSCHGCVVVGRRWPVVWPTLDEGCMEVDLTLDDLLGVCHGRSGLWKRLGDVMMQARVAMSLVLLLAGVVRCLLAPGLADILRRRPELEVSPSAPSRL